MNRVPQADIVELLLKVGISIIPLSEDLAVHCTGFAPVPGVEGIVALAAVAVTPGRKFSAVDIVHEAAHLIAAKGRTIKQRVASINDDFEENGTLQVECRLWNSLGFTDAEVFAELEKNHYDVDRWEEWNRRSTGTRRLVRRGILRRRTEELNFEEARRWVRAPTKKCCC
jgi:hypothetical protein